MIFILNFLKHKILIIKNHDSSSLDLSFVSSIDVSLIELDPYQTVAVAYEVACKDLYVIQTVLQISEN